jgi:glycosyltransferase involved in cell wall biosynthesis
MILFILPSLSGGGAERVVVNYLLQLHLKGYTVGLILFKKKGPLLSLIPDTISVYNLGSNSLKRSFFPMIRMVKKLNPEIIFSTFGYVNVSLLAFRCFLPPKTKIWIREANLPSISLNNNPYPYFMKLAYHYLYRKADYVFCTSDLMRKELILDFNVPKVKIELLHNPIDEKKIRSSVEYIRRKNLKGWSFIASGRLTHQKGFDRLLLWFSKLNDSNNTLIILGEGVLEKSLKSDIRSLGIQKQVSIIGFVNNPWQYYAEADVFILSSRWEGMSNAALEALSCGTPIISTSSSGGIKEVQEKSKDESVVIIDNDEQFIKAINNLNFKKESSVNPSLLPKEYHLETSFLSLEGFILNS